MKPEWLGHMDHARERLLSEIAPLSEEELNRKPAPDAWSIAQICQHLVLTERLVMGAIRRGLESMEETVPDKPVHLIRDRSRKLRSPAMAVPGDERLTKRQILERLQATRQQMTELLVAIGDESRLTRHQYQHPIIGDLSLRQWVELLPIHEERHIAQIRESLI